MPICHQAKLPNTKYLEKPIISVPIDLQPSPSTTQTDTSVMIAG